jgi:ATP-dependent RNA helicase DDX49/DBP8
MSQNNRLASLGKFRAGKVKYLVATDVASRGLDIAPVKTVINFNTPKAVNDYIHRVGRTARAGRGGKAITFVSERDVALLQAIEKKIGIKMPAVELPAEEEVLRAMGKVNSARRAANLHLTESEFGERKKKRQHMQGLRDAAAGGAVPGAAGGVKRKDKEGGGGGVAPKTKKKQKASK